MPDVERIAVAGFILLLLGVSYLFAVAAFARAYLVPATVAYLVVAAVLALRILRAGDAG